VPGPDVVTVENDALTGKVACPQLTPIPITIMNSANNPLKLVVFFLLLGVAKSAWHLQSREFFIFNRISYVLGYKEISWSKFSFEIYIKL
jgi:hypothetical protein